MKVKVLCRNPNDYLRETKFDIHKVPRNYNPSLHPFESNREYVRASNAVKLERVFAKPFIGSLDGHKDVIQCLVNHPKKLSVIVSGCADGEIKLWDLPRKRCIQTLTAHSGFVRGICFPRNGENFYSVGDDRLIKQWDFHCLVDGGNDEPINTIISKNVLTGISHHSQNSQFVTCGDKVSLWDESRAEPLQTFEWGVDSLFSVKFNPVETNLIASCGNDRSIILYDIRQISPIRKVILEMMTNNIAWNPTEAQTFTAANEDHNLYTFDIRRLDFASNVHMDHVSAVIDLDYSPTGKEFVSGSYDKTIRIFPAGKGRSREVYHTKRMQRLHCVSWSLDNKYVLSGSDEMNIRIWKANASEKLGIMQPREKTARNYNDILKEKFQYHPQLKKIARHRHVPKPIYHARKEKRIMMDSKNRKEGNKRLHSKLNSYSFAPERKKHVVEEQE